MAGSRPRLLSGAQAGLLTVITSHGLSTWIGLLTAWWLYQDLFESGMVRHAYMEMIVREEDVYIHSRFLDMSYRTIQEILGSLRRQKGWGGEHAFTGIFAGRSG